MPWSYAGDRRFVEIAEASKSFDGGLTRRNPVAVRKAALKLGVKLANQNATNKLLAAGLKAKQ
jgi:hypothetical protein